MRLKADKPATFSQRPRFHHQWRKGGGWEKRFCSLQNFTGRELTFHYSWILLKIQILLNFVKYSLYLHVILLRCHLKCSRGHNGKEYFSLKCWSKCSILAPMRLLWRGSPRISANMWQVLLWIPLFIGLKDHDDISSPFKIDQTERI